MIAVHAVIFVFLFTKRNIKDTHRNNVALMGI